MIRAFINAVLLIVGVGGMLWSLSRENTAAFVIFTLVVIFNVVTWYDIIAGRGRR